MQKGLNTNENLLAQRELMLTVAGGKFTGLPPAFPIERTLYAASHGLHHQLDQHPVLALLFSPELGLLPYCANRSKLYHGMMTLETALTRYQQQGLPERWTDYRPRATCYGN